MKITDFLKDNLLFLDGGMGTLLQEKGLAPGQAPESLNLTDPALIRSCHKAYFDAGAHMVCTNTFGANPLKMPGEDLEAVIKAALENAFAAREESCGTQEKWVALDVGPTGKLLAPMGELDFEAAVAAFAQVIRLGVKHGAQLIFIETMNDSYETKAALLAAKESCDLPVFVSNAYSENGKLLTGADPAAMIAMLEAMGADAIGVNCSLGPKALTPVVEQYLQYASVPVLFKPNAGLPRVTEGKTVFDVGPAEFVRDMKALAEKGLHAMGGCCGTTPEYIRALTDACKSLRPLPTVEKELTWVSSGTHAVFFGQRPVLIGERINPTGKKRIKQALKEGDIDHILQLGLTQKEQGAQILDVNVGLPEINEEQMLRKIVCELQAVVDLPLQIDTSDPAAMAAALRRYNGKAMLNSVSGKQESMDAVFPLAKKYGGLVVALTLDENGIPPKAEARLEIARRILHRAEHWGLTKKDLIFDPLAMTISADNSAALETLKAIRLIRRELGCHTTLGVSNVSFGLPRRELVNSSFFALALGHGLSAAIMNPASPEMMQVWYACNALQGLDESCADYIAFTETLPRPAELPAASGTSSPAKDREPERSPLQQAIIKGLREQAVQHTEALLKSCPPLEIVQAEIIPALDTVGADYEQQRIYLPQLLMSAEAAKAAFSGIKAAMEGRSEPETNNRALVLATVKGDVHDIGKNIVRLLLENYGFAVTDLGRDVPPETVAETVCALHAPLAGLSALMTTTVPAMEETIRLLREKAPWCKVVVGGAVLNREYAAAIGADKYAKDAMDTVRYAEEVFAGL